MQKKAHNYAGKRILPAKKLMIYMKISALFLLLAMQVSATNYAQGKINLNATNTTISEILKEIESQSSYKFNYSNDILPAQKLISIEAKNADISSVLTKVFEGLPVSWKIVEKNNIVLTPNLIEIIQGKI